MRQAAILLGRLLQPDDKTPEGGRNTFVTAGDRTNTKEQKQELEQKKVLKILHEQEQGRHFKSQLHHNCVSVTFSGLG